MRFTENEMEVLNDRDFLISKIEIIDKIHRLFEEVRTELFAAISEADFNFPGSVDIKLGKIFKGENYKSLPYVVLDYPKLFSAEDTFSLRTMFWWGNFFSTTLYLEGLSLKKYREKIFHNSSIISSKNIYISINDSPWEYHYGQDNYVLLEESNLELIKKVKFLKLSRKYDLDNYNKMPLLASDFLRLCIELLN